MSTFFLEHIVGFILDGLQLEDADAGVGSCKLSSVFVPTSGFVWIDFHFVFMDSIQRYGYVEIGIYRIAALLFAHSVNLSHVASLVHRSTASTLI